MKRYLILLLLIFSLVAMTGCGGSSGPDVDALPPLETAGTHDPTSGGYSRSDTIVIYQENLSSGVSFELYEDGRLLLSGADITSSIVDEPAFKDYADSITTIELGEGVTAV